MFGGTCVNTGCISTKAMASAYAAHLVPRAGEFGVDVGGPCTVDMKRVKARKDALGDECRDLDGGEGGSLFHRLILAA